MLIQESKIVVVFCKLLWAHKKEQLWPPGVEFDTCNLLNNGPNVYFCGRSSQNFEKTWVGLRGNAVARKQAPPKECSKYEPQNCEPDVRTTRTLPMTLLLLL